METVRCIFVIDYTVVGMVGNWNTNIPKIHHLSPGSSMVRASHRRSEGCGFDSRLGAQKHFSGFAISLSSKQFTIIIVKRLIRVENGTKKLQKPSRLHGTGSKLCETITSTGEI